MAKFKSTYNGTVLEFTNENDIEGLRNHPGYVEVIEDALGETKDTGHNPARTVHPSPIPPSDTKTGVPAKTGVRGKRKG